MADPAQQLASLVAQLGMDRVTLMLGEQKRASLTTVPQPPITVTISQADWVQVVNYWHTPIQEDEANVGGIDILCQAVFDAVDSGSPENTLFAALRLSRKMFYLQPHLGPIEGVGIPNTTLAP